MADDWDSLASSSRAQPRDLYCTARIIVYARGKTMSWCCLTSGDERFAIKTLGYGRNDVAHEALSKLRGASDFYAPHHDF